MDVSPRGVVSLLCCSAAALAAPASAAELASPRAGEIFFGAVRAAAPPRATRATLLVDRRVVASRPVQRGFARFRLVHPPGRYDVSVRFQRSTRIVATASAGDVWLLPRSAQQARRERRRDAVLAGRLGRLGRSFAGYAAFWVHDLRSGRTAGWNSDASFPAASTVKLGVLLAALRRFGPYPEGSAAWRDIRDLSVWSSNVASNRLLIRLGGSEARGAAIAQAALWRAGARASTFTGNYRLGTSRASNSLLLAGERLDAPRPLPFLAFRRTTAHDLGRILFELHAAALGNRLSLRRTGLTLHEARLGLALLLSSDPSGDNLGLLRRSFPAGIPLAQKQGWTTFLRHTAAIVYGPSGPKIAVVLTYRPKLAPQAAARLGRRFAALLR